MYRVSIFDQLFNEIEDYFYQPRATTSSYYHFDGRIKRFFKDGALHKVDGPALIEYADDGTVKREEYYLDGVKVSKKEVEDTKQKLDDEKIHTINLGSKSYKVTGKKLKELEKTLGLT